MIGILRWITIKIDIFSCNIVENLKRPTIMIFRRTLKTILIVFVFIFYAATEGRGNIVVLNGLTHENVSRPGESYRETIEIQNTGDTEKSVRVYLRDYWFAYTGESRHDPPGTLERSNAAWINYNPQLLTLQPNEKAVIDFEVTTPDDPSLVGTYWSVIMVEGIIPPDTSAASVGVKINTAIRYAVQVITNIGDTGEKDLQFIGLELGKDGEENVLHVALENIGEGILKPELSLEVFDESGNSVGIFRADRRKTFPGTSIKSTLVLEGIKPGNYSAVLVADCDEDHIYGTNISLEI